MVPPFRNFSGKATTGTPPASPVSKDRRASGPQAAGAASGVQSEECNGSQSDSEARSRCRTGEVAAKAHSLVAAEYAGLTVGQLTAMRKKARETGVFLKVAKNTLVARGAGYRIRVRQGRARRSAAVRLLDRKTPAPPDV